MKVTEGSFQKIIPETDDIEDSKVKRIILCCGKIYYKLHEVRTQKYDNTTAIVRVEQLYPFPGPDITALKEKYPNIETVVWCQDEPRNQGAWREFKSRLNDVFGPFQVKFAGRISAASPAAGYMAMHIEQESKLVTDAFEL
jgi:2-oxoglutarate dehydrogenase E1 component